MYREDEDMMLGGGGGGDGYGGPLDLMRQSSLRSAAGGYAGAFVTLLSNNSSNSIPNPRLCAPMLAHTERLADATPFPTNTDQPISNLQQATPPTAAARRSGPAGGATAAVGVAGGRTRTTTGPLPRTR